jgi:hypothetical protein
MSHISHEGKSKKKIIEKSKATLKRKKIKDNPKKIKDLKKG